MPRTLAQVESDIDAWIAQSNATFRNSYVDQDGKVWVLKFFDPKYLSGFMRRPQFAISTTAGFTWGDGAYVVPLAHVYSAMIYGRVGAMGWFDSSEMPKTLDATSLVGLSLYMEWIQFRPGLFRMLTTTVHADFSNRKLRNAFRQRFEIDLVFFRPDEFNRAYVQPAVDRWFVISDFLKSTALATGSVGFSGKIHECELVAIGTEEFAISSSKFVRQDMLGPELRPPGSWTRPSLASALMTAYTTNRTRGGNPPTYIVPKP
jgi:hypothetical protein